MLRFVGRFASTVTLTLESTDNGIYPYAFEIDHNSKTLYDRSGDVIDAASLWKQLVSNSQGR